MRRTAFILGFLYLWFPEISLYGQDHDGIPNTKLVIKDIVIEGNTVTKEKIIIRELVFLKGDTINKIDMLPAFDRSQKNLKNLSIFNFVSFDAKHYPNNRIDVIITVTERWYIWPTPIFEIADRNFSAFLEDLDWSHTNYGMWLKWNNFRGRNELLSAKFRLGYKEQYLLQYENCFSSSCCSSETQEEAGL